MIPVRICENSFFVFVKCMYEFNDNKELLKYCFLMQDYRNTQKKNRERDQQNMSDELQFSINLNVHGDFYSPFSIESNVVLKKTCPLVENQECLDIGLSEFASSNSLDISSLDKHIQLLDTIYGERTIYVYYFILKLTA